MERKERRRIKEDMLAGRTPYASGRAERRRIRRKTDRAIKLLLDLEQYNAYRRTIRRKRKKRRG